MGPIRPTAAPPRPPPSADDEAKNAEDEASAGGSAIDGTATEAEGDFRADLHSADVDLQLSAMTRYRRRLATNVREPPIQAVIEQGVVPDWHFWLNFMINFGIVAIYIYIYRVKKIKQYLRE